MKHICKKFKKWLDYNPPGALTSTEWRLFEKEYRELAPVRFWITHTLKYNTILPLQWKYNEITEWVRYRTYDRYDIVKTGLTPNYYGRNVLILHMNFNLLKDYVECSLANLSRYHDHNLTSLTFIQKWVPFGMKFQPFRNSGLGITHLEWAATLDDPTLPINEQSTQQAVDAREQLALYTWWTEIRPNRKEIDCGTYGRPEDSIWCDIDRDAPDYKAYVEKSNLRDKMSEEWDNEDTEMLIRLMKIRDTLWT